MIYLGDNELLGVKLGNDDIAGIYVGDNLIYPTTVTGWSVSPSSIEVARTGGTATVRITSLSAWTISSNESWITFSPISGDSGRTSVVANFGENETGVERYGTITATDGTNTSTVSVTQYVCQPLVLSDHLGNTNNQGKTYGNKFYLFDSGVTDITPCEYNFFGIQSICVRTDAFFTGTKVASFGNGGDGCATTLKNAIIDCSGVSCVNFSFGADRITYSSLTSVEMYNTDNVTWFGNFVYWCPNVESVKLGNLSNVTQTNPGGRIFGTNNTAKLTVLEIDGLPDANLTSSVWGFNYLTNLTVNSLLSIINALPTTTNNRTIVLGAENIAKLTAEQLAIATNKGWSVVPA